MESESSIVPVVLSGGTGSRLWPLSRENYPKQFLPLVNQGTMLQETVQRVLGIAGIEKPIVVCNDEHRFLVTEQLTQCECGDSPVILEPFGRNTAPATALAALLASEMFPDPLLLVLPSDHAVRDVARFRRCITKAVPYAQDGYLVTFGATPSFPESGYGYIKKGPALRGDSVFGIERFVEKPDEITAKRYVDSGNFLWNSGMFLFRSSRFMAELGSSNPHIVSACEAALSGAVHEEPFVIIDSAAFRSCPSDSIDYSVMEKTQNGAVVLLDAGWSDVGSWFALWEMCTRDADGNAVHGDVVAVDVENCYLHAKDRLLTAVGVRDLMIVETEDAVLALHKDRVQDVKAVVEQLRLSRHRHLQTHRCYRPWGGYCVIDEDEGFKVKRITVNPGAGLSLQLHHHRSEHWTVVKGTALVTCGDETKLISVNECAYIPLGVRHRLENPGIVPLEVIEVQSGSYLGEDDIVRFKDRYGRACKDSTNADIVRDRP